MSSINEKIIPSRITTRLVGWLVPLLFLLFAAIVTSAAGAAIGAGAGTTAGGAAGGAVGSGLGWASGRVADGVDNLWHRAFDSSGDAGKDCEKETAPAGRVPRATNGGQPVEPDPSAEARPHSRIGTEPGRNGPYRQGFTFYQNGDLAGRTDVTDLSRPDTHPNPHFHPWNGPNGGWGPGQPVPPEGGGEQ